MALIMRTKPFTMWSLKSVNLTRGGLNASTRIFWSRKQYCKTHLDVPDTSSTATPQKGIAKVSKCVPSVFESQAVFGAVSRLRKGFLDVYRPSQLSIRLLTSMPRGALPAKVTWRESDGHLTVAWNHLEEPCQFPFVWLRDCCQCENCILTFGSRTHLLADLDLDIRPTDVQVTNDDVNITWKDNHVTTYSTDWLLKMRFPARVSDISLRHLGPEKKLWDHSIFIDPPTQSFDNVIGSDTHLLQWINNLEEHGICYLEDAGQEVGAVYKLANRVGYPKNTPFGTLFELKTLPTADVTDVGYTNNTLELHTDQSMWSYVPGVLVLHCIRQSQSKGGMSELSDGFKAANILREERPAYYEILTKPVGHYWMQEHADFQYNMLQCQPTIRLNALGEPCQVIFSNHFRAPLIHLPGDQVHTFYAALKAFQEILYRPENLLRFRLKGGDVVCFDNHRVLHGRTGWDKTTGVRHLTTMYLDWDEMMSRRRVLSLGESMM